MLTKQARAGVRAGPCRAVGPGPGTRAESGTGAGFSPGSGYVCTGDTGGE